MKRTICLYRQLHYLSGWGSVPIVRFLCRAFVTAIMLLNIQSLRTVRSLWIPAEAIVHVCWLVLRGKCSHKSAGHNEKCSSTWYTEGTISLLELSWDLSLKLFCWFCRTVIASDGCAIFVLALWCLNGTPGLMTLLWYCVPLLLQ